MKLCVYCSSSDLIEAKYFAIAKALGERLLERGDTLVYGGSRVGLMGEIARTVHNGGGHVIGVMPKALMEIEISNPDCDEFIVTKDMRERKGIMADYADAFLALPGGLGTLEEITEIMTERKLGLTQKPMVLLNTDHFYEPFNVFLRHMQEAHFITGSLEILGYFADTLDDTFAHFDTVGVPPSK